MQATAMGKQARAWNAWLCLFIALYVLLGTARLLHNSDLQRLTPFISVTILMAFAIVHGIRRYGWTHFVVFFLVAFVVSWSYETVSILTGFPFGHYVYTDKLSSEEIVRLRDQVEEEARAALSIPFNPGAPGVRFEASMGQLGRLPANILRSSGEHSMSHGMVRNAGTLDVAEVGE